jgi:hypothetical protein
MTTSDASLQLCYMSITPAIDSDVDSHVYLIVSIKQLDNTNHIEQIAYFINPQDIIL